PPPLSRASEPPSRSDTRHRHEALIAARPRPAARPIPTTAARRGAGAARPRRGAARRGHQRRGAGRRLGHRHRGADEPGPEARHLLRRAAGRRPRGGGGGGAEPSQPLPARPARAAHRAEGHARPGVPARRELRRGRPNGSPVPGPARAARPRQRPGRLMGRRRKGEAVSGWVCLDKPYDLTSTHAVSRVRRIFNAQKVGHAGTLDPLATGILPIALGEATKTVPFLVDADKSYRFTLAWGATTTTLDREGAVVATSDVRPAREQVEAVLPRFIGEIEIGRAHV